MPSLATIEPTVRYSRVRRCSRQILQVGACAKCAPGATHNDDAQLAMAVEPSRCLRQLLQHGRADRVEALRSVERETSEATIVSLYLDGLELAGVSSGVITKWPGPSFPAVFPFLCTLPFLSCLGKVNHRKGQMQRSQGKYMSRSTVLIAYGQLFASAFSYTSERVEWIQPCNRSFS